MTQPVINYDRYLTESVARVAFTDFVHTLQGFDDSTLCIAFEQLTTAVRNPYATTLKAIEFHHALQTETLLEKYRAECAALTETLNMTRLAMARKTFFLQKTTAALEQTQAVLCEVNATMALMEEFLTGQFTSNTIPVMEGGGTTVGEIRSLLSLGESVVADRDLFMSALETLDTPAPHAGTETEGGRRGGRRGQ